jgi:hypothetical protein
MQPVPDAKQRRPGRDQPSARRLEMESHRHRCRKRWGLCAETENPSCETPLRLTTHIAAQSFKKLAKDCGRR